VSAARGFPYQFHARLEESWSFRFELREPLVRQAKGKTADRRADIWAFGVVLFEMLTG
jgi:serine/threonine protein kinase